MSRVHLIVPGDIDDPARPSGGNLYDRKIADGLAGIGWSVDEYGLPGDWPAPDASARQSLTATLGALADNALVLIDGLVASTATDLPAFAERLRVVVLLHMPLAGAEARAVERAALSAAAGVVATSNWTRNWLIEHYGLEPDRIHVVEPGADAADATSEASGGEQLLCVAAVTPAKGQDVLVAALAQVASLSWDCVCVGPVDRDPNFVERLRLEAARLGIAERIRFVGPRTGAELGATYADADAVIVCSRSETYGMVVTEALARGIPVIAAAVGGVPEALGWGTLEESTAAHRSRADSTSGTLPGILVPEGDAGALAGALRRWLGDGDLRLRLQRAALTRREDLRDWTATAVRLSEVLDEAAR
jgi:glycosyltransferase involved in cell wall biosynthesis